MGSAVGQSMLIGAAHLQPFRQITVEIDADIPALAAVGVLARALQNAPRRLHRVGDAVDFLGQTLKTNPDHDNLLGKPAPPVAAQPKITAPKKSEKV